MMIKLAIIGAILLVGAIIFSNEINQLLPQTFHETETKVGVTVDTVNNEVNDFTESSIDLLSENINELTESTQEIFGFAGILGNEQNQNTESAEQHTTESVERHTTVSSNKETNNQVSSVESSSSNSATATSTATTTSQTFQTLSLTTSQQQGDSLILHYEDTSEKTTSVTVTLRTSEKELFSGIFYTSMFETIVNEATDAPYFIEMIVVHEEYGTISSSVFNPGNTPDTVINGVFSQS